MHLPHVSVEVGDLPSYYVSAMRTCPVDPCANDTRGYTEGLRRMAQFLDQSTVYEVFQMHT